MAELAQPAAKCSLPTPTTEATAIPAGEEEAASAEGAGDESAETATPEPTETPTTDSVEIEARSADRGVQRGEAARYRFRVTNTTDYQVSVQLRTTDSAAGWTSRIYEADGTTELASTVKLDAGGSMDVIVRVSSPTEAGPGDQNTTSLDAFGVERTD